MTLLAGPVPGTEPAIRAHDQSRSMLARARLPAAREALAACQLCSHRCGADRRSGPAGLCHAGPEARFFSAQTEVADELELLPTFAIALSGCSFRCDFCITGESSWNPKAGLALDAQAMAAQAARALEQGARTVMVLGGEPTIHLPALLEWIARLPDRATLVLKTNGALAGEAPALLAGLPDVWLPDFKFGNDDCARRLAGVPDYFATLTSNLQWMGTSDAGGSLLVRHLVMPSHLECCTAPVIHWLARHLPTAQRRISLRQGYWPAWHARRHPELSRHLHATEFDQAVQWARDNGLEVVP